MKELLRKNNVKTLWPYFFIFMVGIALMCVAKYASGISGEASADAEIKAPEIYEPEKPLYDSGYEATLEQKLSSVLSEVKGVGRVQVLLTLSYKGQVELAEDTVYEATQTTGSGGDEKSLVEKKEVKNVIITGKDGKMAPIVIKSIAPKIEGVVIVAEGGDSAEIKAMLTKAASALLNLPAHKIEVLKMNK